MAGRGGLLGRGRVGLIHRARPGACDQLSLLQEVAVRSEVGSRGLRREPEAAALGRSCPLVQNPPAPAREESSRTLESTEMKTLLSPLRSHGPRPIFAPRRHARAAGLVATVLVMAAAWGVQPEVAKPAAAADPVRGGGVYDCISRPSDIRELGFSLRGKIEEVTVKPGETVKQGQSLVRLDRDVQRFLVESARLQAEDDSQVRLTERQLVFRREELGLIEKARASDGGTDAQLREARFRSETAAIEVEAAKSRAAMNVATLRREEAELEDMEIRSPIDGVILDLRKRPGETVDEGTPILTVLTVDPLWLDVSLPYREGLPIEPGRLAEVVWDDIDDKTPMRGRVIYKAPAGNAGARQIQLRIEVANPGRIPSGMHGKIRFLTQASDAATGTGATGVANMQRQLEGANPAIPQTGPGK